MSDKILPASRKLISQMRRWKKNRRLHMTSQPDLEILPTTSKLTLTDKPRNGFWYGINHGWLEWCATDMQTWLEPFIYEVIVDDSKIFKIQTLEQFESFEEEYTTSRPRLNKTTNFLDFPNFLDSIFSSLYRDCVDYPRLAQNWAGLEIAPYFWEKRLTSPWYYSWDCASGCIWDTSIIKETPLFAKFRAGKFVRRKIKKNP